MKKLIKICFIFKSERLENNFSKKISKELERDFEEVLMAWHDFNYQEHQNLVGYTLGIIRSIFNLNK